MKKIIIFIACFALTILASQSIFAANHYVSPAGGNSSPYTNWADAAINIQDAIDVATSGEKVIVTDGVYNLVYQLMITNDITVESVNGYNKTILTRDDTPPPAMMDVVTNRLVYLKNNNAVIDGFTVTNGYTYRADGAGILCEGGTIQNCLIVDNYQQWGLGTTYYGGGGVCIVNTGALLNCIIRDNFVVGAGDGGGVWMYGGGGIVSNCLISGNIAGYGGGIESSKATIIDSEISDNFTQVASGGGVLAFKGTLISNCLVKGNSSTTDGGGISLFKGATVIHSIIENNSALDIGGGGIRLFNGGLVDSCKIIDNNFQGVMFMQGGELRNSLIAQNDGGGIYYFDNSGTTKVVNCTIATNTGYGVFAKSPGEFHNSIIYFNTFGDYTNTGGAVFSNCCADASLPGSNNITNYPGFLNIDSGNYRLTANSACINTGEFFNWMTGAKDLAGNDRIIDGIVDLGCYEYGGIACAFSGSPREGLTPLTVQFTGITTGSETNPVSYYWDFNNDGIIDFSGVESNSPVYIYTNEGRFSVNLIVSNSAGESAEYFLQNYIYSFNTNIHYVASAGSNIFPFTSRETAAHKIEDAVDATLDGHFVIVTNGTYSLENQILIEKNILISSVNGKSETIINGNGHRCFYIDNADATIDGFTLTNGDTSAELEDNGGGVYFNNHGIIINSDILDCEGHEGGGAYLIGNCFISNCVFKGNYASGNSGGGIYANSFTSEILIVNSEISHNFAEHWGGGGIIAYNSTTISKCSIHDNHVDGNDNGGGVYLNNNSKIEDSVIYNNSSENDGGGICTFWEGQKISNCIISNNFADAIGGGVCFLGAGIIENSVICSNSAFNGAGIGVRYISGFDGGIINKCIIYSNSATYGGGVFAERLAHVRNSLVYGNHAITSGGGIELWFSGEIENSTICNNSSDDRADGIRFYSTPESTWSPGYASNSIVYFNGDENYLVDIPGNGSLDYSCIYPYFEGAGNITNDPMLVNPAIGDYRLNSDSLCVNAGANLNWMTSSTDLSGLDRILYGTVDIGAYETPLALWCDFQANNLKPVADENVIFTADVRGSNVASIFYGWDFNANGTNDMEGTDCGIITNYYSETGFYSVALTISNDIGETYTRLKENYIEVIPEPVGIVFCIIALCTLLRRGI